MGLLTRCEKVKKHAGVWILSKALLSFFTKLLLSLVYKRVQVPLSPLDGLLQPLLQVWLLGKAKNTLSLELVRRHVIQTILFQDIPAFSVKEIWNVHILFIYALTWLCYSRCVAVEVGWSISQHLVGERPATPVHHRADIGRHIYTHSQTHRQLSVFNPPDLHVFGLWEGTGAPGGNPRNHVCCEVTVSYPDIHLNYWKFIKFII